MTEILAVVKLLLELMSRAGGPELFAKWMSKNETTVKELHELVAALPDVPEPRK